MSLALLLEGSLPPAPPGKSLKQEALTQIYKYVLDNPILIPGFSWDKWRDLSVICYSNGKKSVMVPKKTKIERWSRNPTPSVYPDKTLTPKDTGTQCSQQSRHGNNVNVHQQMNEERCGMCVYICYSFICVCGCVYIYTQWNTIQL